MSNVMSDPGTIGTVAGLLVSGAMLPQLFKLVKTKKADDVSTGMLIVLICGVALWVYYGILKNEIPIIATNAFSCIINGAILFSSIKYKK